MQKINYFILCSSVLFSMQGAVTEKQEVLDHLRDAGSSFQMLMNSIARANKDEIKKIILENPELINTKEAFIVNRAGRSVRHRSDFDAYFHLESTPLLYAIHRGKPSIVELLITLGASLDKDFNHIGLISYFSSVQKSSEKREAKRALKIKAILGEKMRRASIVNIARAAWKKQYIKDAEKEKARKRENVESCFLNLHSATKKNLQKA